MFRKFFAYSATHPDVQGLKKTAPLTSTWAGSDLMISRIGEADAYAAVEAKKDLTETSTAINEVSASARQFGMVAGIPDGTGESAIR